MRLTPVPTCTTCGRQTPSQVRQEHTLACPDKGQYPNRFGQDYTRS